MTTAERPIRILVVDDSAFMRKALSIMLESDPMIKVVGTAVNGEDGVNKAKRLNPDLVTMDIEMPVMDGLTALKQIMESNPVPVVMVSSISTQGAEATLKALEIGAVDFIPKQMSYVSLDIVKIKDDLLAKIKDIVKRRHLLMAQYRTSRLSRKKTTTAAPVASISTGSSARRRKSAHPIQVIAIGSSTGGPLALQRVIEKLPGNLPVGIVIAQHMPPTFTKSLAGRLNELSALTVYEATNNQIIEPGLVLIAPGGQHLRVKRYGGQMRAVISDDPADALYKPDVDVLFDSVAETTTHGTLAVVLTGMGSNGLKGAASIKEQGGCVIAQDEATSVVYGMPKAVAEAGLVDHVSPLDQIASEITSYF